MKRFFSLLIIIAFLSLLLTFGCIKPSKTANLGCCDVSLDSETCTYNPSSGDIKFSDPESAIEESFPGLIGSVGNCNGRECVFDLGETSVSVPICNSTEEFKGLGCSAVVCGVEKKQEESSFYSPADLVQAQYLGINISEESKKLNIRNQIKLPSVGLLHTNCEVINIDSLETKKKLKNNLFMSLRIGMGRSFEDYEMAKEYFPLSDYLCSLNPSGKVERYTNYYFAFLDRNSGSYGNGRKCLYSPSKGVFFYHENGKTVFFSSFSECLKEASISYSHDPSSLAMYAEEEICKNGNNVEFPFASSPRGNELPTSSTLYPIYYSGPTYSGTLGSGEFRRGDSNIVYEDIHPGGKADISIDLYFLDKDLSKLDKEEYLNVTFHGIRTTRAYLKQTLPTLYLGRDDSYYYPVYNGEGGNFLYTKAKNYSHDPFALPFECSNNADCVSGYCNKKDYQRTVILANYSGETVAILDSWCFEIDGILSCIQDGGSKSFIGMESITTEGYALMPGVYTKNEKGGTDTSVVAPRSWTTKKTSSLIKGRYKTVNINGEEKKIYLSFSLPTDNKLYNNVYIDWKGHKEYDKEKFNRGIDVYSAPGKGHTLWYCKEGTYECWYVAVGDRNKLCRGETSDYVPLMKSTIWGKLKNALLSGKPGVARVCGKEYVACANPIFWNTTDDFKIKINNYCTGNDYDPLGPGHQGGVEDGVLEYYGMSLGEAREICSSLTLADFCISEECYVPTTDEINEYPDEIKGEIDANFTRAKGLYAPVVYIFGDFNDDGLIGDRCIYSPQTVFTYETYGWCEGCTYLTMAFEKITPQWKVYERTVRCEDSGSCINDEDLGKVGYMPKVIAIERNYPSRSFAVVPLGMDYGNTVNNNMRESSSKGVISTTSTSACIGEIFNFKGIEFCSAGHGQIWKKSGLLGFFKILLQTVLGIVGTVLSWLIDKIFEVKTTVFLEKTLPPDFYPSYAFIHERLPQYLQAGIIPVLDMSDPELYETYVIMPSSDNNNKTDDESIKVFNIGSSPAAHLILNDIYRLTIKTNAKEKDLSKVIQVQEDSAPMGPVVVIYSWLPGSDPKALEKAQTIKENCPTCSLAVGVEDVDVDNPSRTMNNLKRFFGGPSDTENGMCQRRNFAGDDCNELYDLTEVIVLKTHADFEGIDPDDEERFLAYEEWLNDTSTLASKITKAYGKPIIIYLSYINFPRNYDVSEYDGKNLPKEFLTFLMFNKEKLINAGVMGIHFEDFKSFANDDKQVSIFTLKHGMNKVGYCAFKKALEMVSKPRTIISKIQVNESKCIPSLSRNYYVVCSNGESYKVYDLVREFSENKSQKLASIIASVFDHSGMGICFEEDGGNYTYTYTNVPRLDVVPLLFDENQNMTCVPQREGIEDILLAYDITNIRMNCRLVLSGSIDTEEERTE